MSDSIKFVSSVKALKASFETYQNVRETPSAEKTHGVVLALLEMCLTNYEKIDAFDPTLIQYSIDLADIEVALQAPKAKIDVDLSDLCQMEPFHEEDESSSSDDTDNEIYTIH